MLPPRARSFRDFGLRVHKRNADFVIPREWEQGQQQR